MMEEIVGADVRRRTGRASYRWIMKTFSPDRRMELFMALFSDAS